MDFTVLIMYVLGLHQILARANPESSHFSEIRLRPNFYLDVQDLADTSAATVRSVNYG